jgi:hypothetical protein
VDGFQPALHSREDRRSGERPNLLLTAILADGINLGISKMAEACPGTTARKLDWLASLHIRDEAYTKALAELVNHHHQHPFAGHWAKVLHRHRTGSVSAPAVAESSPGKSICAMATSRACSSTPIYPTSIRPSTAK